MAITMYALAIDTFVPVLNTLSDLLDKGSEHARSNGIDVDELAGARLAPDMFPLWTQVEICCHHPRDATARLTGRTPPEIEHRELSYSELKPLVQATIKHLKGIPESAFAGAENRPIRMSLRGSMMFESNGFQLLRDWSIPHFYFHVVTTYDILRHRGVELGKRDFMGHIRPYLKGG
jgi:uncharacterized protein